MGSLGQALRRAEGTGRSRGVVVALLVAGTLVAQGIEVTQGTDPPASAFVWILPSLCLAGLGAILGFWAGRLRATDGWRALARRYMRGAYPPYALAILAALVIGPAVTTTERRAFVLDPASWSYLLNLLAIPRYTLPGVFAENGLADLVNPWVWTAPVFLVLLGLCCLVPGRRSAWWASAGLFAIVALAALVGQAIDFTPGAPDSLATLLAQGDGLTLVLAVILGLFVAALREQVPTNGWLGLGAAAILVGAASRGGPAWLAFPAFRIVAVIPAGYLALTAMTWRLPLSRPAARIEPILPALLLLAFPLQQVAIDRGPAGQGLLLNLALATPVAAIVSAAFWWVAGRRLIPWTPPPPARADEAPAMGWRGRIGRLPRVRWADIAGATALSVALSALFVLVMAMLYIASVPDDAGG